MTDTLLDNREASLEALEVMRQELESRGAFIDATRWARAGGLLAKRDMLETAAMALPDETRGTETADEPDWGPDYRPATRAEVVEGLRSGQWEVARSYRPAAAEHPDSYHQAFRSYLVGGPTGLTSAERDTLRSGWHQFTRSEHRALGATGTGAAGGYLVPAVLRNQILSQIKSFAGLWDSGRVLDIGTETGASLALPTNDDTANVGVIVSENSDTSSPAIADPAFGQVVLGAYTYTSRPLRVSFQMLQDSSIGNLEGYLTNLLATRIGRAIAPHLVTGTGSGQPEGIVTNATVGVTAASATAVTADELTDMVAALDVGYRRNAAWLMSPDMQAVVEKIKDSNNRPLWVDGLGAVPDRLKGYPVVLDPAMPAPTTGNKALLFGDFAAGYAVRHVTGEGMLLLRLSERFAEFGQVGFLLFYRLDAAPVLASYIALQMA